MIQPTSIASLESILPALSSRQRDVLAIIRQAPGIDNLGIAALLELPINSITPRVLELRNAGIVRCCGKKRNKTGRMAMTWEVTKGCTNDNPRTDAGSPRDGA